jgi:hypothetical protein
MGDLPDKGNKETDNMIGVSYNSLVSAFASLEDHDERFQNGSGFDIVSQGRYFRPVVHTARRNNAFNASNVWQGPVPTFHGLPYSYTKRGEGDGITLRRCLYPLPLLLVNFSTTHHNSMWKLKDGPSVATKKYSIVQFKRAYSKKQLAGTSAELHVGFKVMVNGLYDMIEKDGLMDPFTGKPAVNFLDKDSFIQKLNLHAQEFQMAVIIVEEFFLKQVEHHHGDIEYWVKEIFQSCIKHKDLVRMFNNIFSLFPAGEDPKLAKKTLENTDAMRDMVSQKANSIEFKARYSELLEKALNPYSRRQGLGQSHHVQDMFCWLIVMLMTGKCGCRLTGRIMIGFTLLQLNRGRRRSLATNAVGLVRSYVACNFLLHYSFIYLSCHCRLMLSFSLFLSCILCTDSLVPAGPVNVKHLTSEPTEEPRVNPNASLPTLADQLA